MTQTDTNLVSEAAKIYKVLSNSRRISILFFLRNASKEVDVSTIATTLTLAKPVVSKQLGILEKYNLVKHHKHGTHVFYFLNDSDVLSMIDAMIEHVEHTAKEHPTNLY